MLKSTDICVKDCALYLIEGKARAPLKFGRETVHLISCARVKMEAEDRNGKRSVGWGETPVSVTWAWPSADSYQSRMDDMLFFCRTLVRAWKEYADFGHPMELGMDFQRDVLGKLLKEHNGRLGRVAKEPMPYLAALICLSAFDLAVHDAYGNLHGVDTYKTYNVQFMNRDLSEFLEVAEDKKASYSFKGKYPQEFLHAERSPFLTAWHLVGGADPLQKSDLTGTEVEDGHPYLLRDWIQRDGLKCIKIKLRGNDLKWDYQRVLDVGKIAIEEGVQWLTTDFNCMVTDVEYVNETLDRLWAEHPDLYRMLLYVEQPFPYELEEYPMDVRSVASRKMLFMDESAHDWQHIRRGRELGWSAVALKTCKTQSGAMLSTCWAIAHGMPLMVQDLSNPMLAMVSHAQLAARVPTIMGIETNGCQFFPEVSKPESAIHPGLYRRRNGLIDLHTLGATGFGYRIDEIHRTLPATVC